LSKRPHPSSIASGVATSLFTSGELHVGGDIDVSTVVYGYYNDNTLSARTIRAPVVIEDDHATDADVDSPHHFDVDRFDQGNGDGVQAELRTIFIGDVFERDATEESDEDDRAILDKRRLFERLREGRDVLRV
jgi:hypothetical protein